VIPAPGSVHERLIAARTAAGVPLADVAEQLMVPLAQLQRYERGHGVPTKEQLEAFARIYGTSPTWLLQGRETPPLKPTDVTPLFGPR
jgi:HTH-type transcriptional regulator, cell division transcriptional repressor